MDGMDLFRDTLKLIFAAVCALAGAVAPRFAQRDAILVPIGTRFHAIEIAMLP